MKIKNSPLKIGNPKKIQPFYRIHRKMMRALCGEKYFFQSYSPDFVHFFFDKNSKRVSQKKNGEGLLKHNIRALGSKTIASQMSSLKSSHFVEEGGGGGG